MLIRPKKVSKERLAAFWRDFDLGKRRRSEARAQKRGRFFDLKGFWKREPVAVSPSMLGVVREFESQEMMRHFLRTVANINQVGQSLSFEHFVFQPIEILSRDFKRRRVLERAFMAPNLYQLIGPISLAGGSLYHNSFFRRIDRHGTSLSWLEKELKEAQAELLHKLIEPLPVWVDSNVTNIVVLGVDSKTKKPVLSIIDPFGSIKTAGIPS